MKGLFTTVIAVQVLIASANPLFGLDGGNNNAAGDAAGAAGAADAADAGDAGAGGLLGALFGGGNNNNADNAGNAGNAGNTGNNAGGGQGNGGTNAQDRNGANGGLQTKSAAQIQEAVASYANDVATVNKFIDASPDSSNGGQLAQDAADAEANEIVQLRVLCPADQADDVSVGAGEACEFLLANTQPIVDMLQDVADVNQNPTQRSQAVMRQTQADISEVRCPQVLPRIQTLLNAMSRATGANSTTAVPRPQACQNINRRSGFFW